MTADGARGTAALHTQAAGLAFLLGRWAGEGEGTYPTIEAFRYGEEITVSHVGKPFLAYAQRTWSLDDGRPLHAETGYLRCPAPARVEFVAAHPTGVVEVSEGTLRGSAIELSSVTVARSASAKEVTALTRRIEVDGDLLRYQVDMAAVGVGMTPHLSAVLQRVSTPPP